MSSSLSNKTKGITQASLGRFTWSRLTRAGLHLSLARSKISSSSCIEGICSRCLIFLPVWNSLSLGNTKFERSHLPHNFDTGRLYTLNSTSNADFLYAIWEHIMTLKDFLCDSVVKNLPYSAGDARDTGSITGLGRSPGEGNDNPLRYSCLGNPMDIGAWWATVHGIASI